MIKEIDVGLLRFKDAFSKSCYFRDFIFDNLNEDAYLRILFQPYDFNSLIQIHPDCYWMVLE